MPDSSLETIAKVGEADTTRALPRRSHHPEREVCGSERAGGGGVPAARRNRWSRPLLILGLVLLVGGALALYLTTGRYVSEEDAYVQVVSASISAQISSQVIGIAIRSNAPVKEDDLLFKIDAEPYRITLADAEAQLGIARDRAHTLIETYTLARGRSMRRELATLMQALDTTIANVALPYMQGGLSATKGTVQLMCNIGASIGISLMSYPLVRTSAIIQAGLVEHITPYRQLIRDHAQHFGLTTIQGRTALTQLVSALAEAVAFIDNFKLMMFVSLLAIPLVMLVQRPPRSPGKEAPSRALAEA
jgi:multidrug efflux pump subunit AcrA (membrane-fusion protein)